MHVALLLLIIIKVHYLAFSVFDSGGGMEIAHKRSCFVCF